MFVHAHHMRSKVLQTVASMIVAYVYLETWLTHGSTHHCEVATHPPGVVCRSLTER